MVQVWWHMLNMAHFQNPNKDHLVNLHRMRMEGGCVFKESDRVRCKSPPLLLQFGCFKFRASCRPLNRSVVQAQWKEGKKKKLWHVFPFPINLGRTFVLRRGGEGRRTISEKTMLQLMDTATIYCPAEQNLLSNSSLLLLIFVRLTWISVSRGLGWQFGANESCFGDNWCDEPGPSLMCVEPGSSPGPERECERLCQNAFSVLKKVWSSSKSFCLLQPTKLYKSDLF